MGKRIFIDDQEMTNKDDFDKKVRLDNSLSSPDINQKLDGSVAWSKIFGIDTGMNWATRQSLLRIAQTGTTNNIFLGNNSAAIFWGFGDTKGGIEVGYETHMARIFGGNNPNIIWHEDIAWQSDIQRLEQEIADLKKQIGGK